jgi:hypothetical protein
LQVSALILELFSKWCEARVPHPGVPTDRSSSVGWSLAASLFLPLERNQSCCVLSPHPQVAATGRERQSRRFFAGVHLLWFRSRVGEQQIPLQQ